MNTRPPEIQAEIIECSKHGELPRSGVFDLKIDYNGTIKRKVYCIQCISEVFDQIMANPGMPSVTIKHENKSTN